MQNQIDLSKLCSSDEEFLRSLAKLTKSIKKYHSYEGHLFDSAEKLYEFLVFDTNISKELERLYVYAHINNDLDLKNSKYQEYYGKVVNLIDVLNEKTSFVITEILQHEYSEFVNYLHLYPKLKDYKLTMKKLFRKKKLIRSKTEEELIAILTSTYGKPEDISEMLINTDLNYGTIKDENDKEVLITNYNYANYLESSNQRVRKEAFDALYKEIQDHQNTFASILATEIVNNNKLAKIRGFAHARDLSLYNNNIKSLIYDQLILGVHKNLPLFYRYFDLKKDILKIDELHIYDTYANITKSFNKCFSYEEAKEILVNSLQVLGNDYVKNIQKAFTDGWIDSRIIANKRSGAYCTCAYTSHPYILCSYEKKLNDISTIAHELGHAMHYMYAQKNNSYQDYEYSIFVAEVASQVNEIILTDYMLKKSTDAEEKKYLLDLILQRFKSTIIRQTMFAEFEDNLHKLESKGEILTNDLITSTYYELNKKYFGDNVVVDEQIKYECYRIPHFYYNFYVYQYATGYAAAIKIANAIIKQEPRALSNYLDFLKLGSTKDPVTSLKIAGVNMLDNSIYDEVFDVFEKRLNELRSLYE